MSIEDKQPKPGDMVVLEGLPPGFLDDLPFEDQIAIRDVIGNRLSSSSSPASLAVENAWSALNLNSGMSFAIAIGYMWIRALIRIIK